jgi:hypothetical protein
VEIVDAAGRFHDITADLALLVFFGPAEGSGDAAEPGEMP